MTSVIETFQIWLCWGLAASVVTLGAIVILMLLKGDFD